MFLGLIETMVCDMDSFLADVACVLRMGDGGLCV